MRDPRPLGWMPSCREKSWAFPEEIKIVDKNDVSGCAGRLQPGVEAEYVAETTHRSENATVRTEWMKEQQTEAAALRGAGGN